MRTLPRGTGWPIPPLDAAVATGLMAIALVEVDGRGTTEALVAGATCSTVALRQKHPRACAVLFCIGLLGLSEMRLADTPTWAFIALLIVSFSIPAALPGRQAGWYLLGLYAVAVTFDAASHEPNLANAVTSPAIIIAVPAAAGSLLYRARRQNAQLIAVTNELTVQRQQALHAATLAERTRIAREMHDVISHTVVTMVVQAGAAEKSLPADHPAAAAIAAVRLTGRQALDELRQVVGLLRTDEVGSDTRPQPGIGQLAELVTADRDLGPVGLEVTRGLEELPASVQLTVFRTVQEALTNASRYAQGSAVSVSVRATDHGICAVVEDDGGRSDHTGPSSGFGLRGLAERAAQHGGVVRCGPRSGPSGWRVELILPVTSKPLP